MIVGIDIDRLCMPERTGLFRLTLGLVKGIRAANLGLRARLFRAHGLSRRNMHPVAARELEGMPVCRFRHPGILWRLRIRYSRFGTTDVFQTMTSLSFPVQSQRVNAYMVPDLTTI